MNMIYTTKIDFFNIYYFTMSDTKIPLSIYIMTDCEKFNSAIKDILIPCLPGFKVYTESNINALQRRLKEIGDSIASTILKNLKLNRPSSSTILFLDRLTDNIKFSDLYDLAKTYELKPIKLQRALDIERFKIKFGSDRIDKFLKICGDLNAAYDNGDRTPSNSICVTSFPLMDHDIYYNDIVEVNSFEGFYKELAVKVVKETDEIYSYSSQVFGLSVIKCLSVSGKNCSDAHKKEFLGQQYYNSKNFEWWIDLVSKFE